MKTTALVLSLFLCPFFGFTQEAPESLLLEHYENEEYLKVLEKADSLLEADDAANVARITQIKADAYYFLNDVNASLDHYLKAIDLSDQYPLTTIQRLECYSHAGFCYKYLGKYIEAIPYYDIAHGIAVSISDSVEIANQASNLGTLYSELGNYRKALGYLNTAYQIDFTLKDTTALAYDLVNLGELKLNIGDTETAIRYLKEGLKVKETIAGDHTTHILRLGKLSYAYLLAKRLDSASFFNQQAIEEAEKIGDDLSLHKQYITSAGISNALGEYSRALQTAQKAYQYFNNEDNSYLVSSTFELSEAYRGLGQDQRAIALLNRVLIISQQNDLLEQSAEIYNRRAELNQKTGNLRAALNDLVSYQSVKDTLQKLDKQRAILILDQEYQTSQKQQQIELLEAREEVARLELAKNKREKLILFTLLIFLLAIAVYVFFSIRRKNDLKNSLLTAQINELRLQIRAVMEGSPENIKLEMEALNSSIQEPLSDREFEILNFAITDLSNTEIAEKTFVSVNTVKYHLKNIYSKLGVSNRREALKFAFQTSSN